MLHFLDLGEGEPLCPGVQCDNEIPEWCEGFIPPGACCPVCGKTTLTTAAKLVFSQSSLKPFD